MCADTSRKAQGVGFHQSLDTDEPDTLFPDAWCDACEAIRKAEGDWNERSEAIAGISLLCSGCYLRARLLNWPRDTHTETARLIERSVRYLDEQQDRLRTRYRLNDHERYDWDQDLGQLVFSNAGVPAVVASIQFVGSVSTRSQTWMWSWANESYLESVRSQVRRVRAYGDEHHLLKLACAYWSAEEEDGWQMSAVTAFLLQAKGTYRSPRKRARTNGPGWPPGREGIEPRKACSTAHPGAMRLLRSEAGASRA